MSRQWDSWDTIESLRKFRDGWYDETQIQLARAETAEARVKVLEEALRNIADGDIHSISCCGWCDCAANIVWQVLPPPDKCDKCKRPYDFSRGRKTCSFCGERYHEAALAAKEKP